MCGVVDVLCLFCWEALYSEQQSEGCPNLLFLSFYNFLVAFVHHLVGRLLYDISYSLVYCNLGYFLLHVMQSFILKTNTQYSSMV